MESDHLPITVERSYKLIHSLKDFSNSYHNIPRRPKLSLNNFDKTFFPILILENINSLSLHNNILDPLQIWYDFIMDCSLKAGAVLFDGMGNRKEYIKGKLTISTFNKSKKERIKLKSNSPWWDKDCDILINKGNGHIKNFQNALRGKIYKIIEKFQLMLERNCKRKGRIVLETLLIV